MLLVSLFGCRSRDEPPTPTAVPTAIVQNLNESTSELVATPAQSTEIAEQPSAPGDQGLAGEIVLWHSWSGPEADAFNEILGRTLNKHPNLGIETLFVPYADLEQRYIEAVQAGGGPDMVVIPNWWLGNLVNSETIVPLAEFVTPDALDVYWPAARDNLHWNGQAYGIPVDFELVSLFYNRALVADDDVPGTTQALLSMVEASPSQGIGLYSSLYHLYWGIPAFGATLLDSNGKVVLDQGGGAANYLNWLIEMNALPGVYIDEDYGMLLDRFKKREFAFFVDGPWSIPDLEETFGDQLGVARLPEGPSGPARPWLSADGFVINSTRGARQQGLATQVALALTDDENSAILAAIGARLPANRNVVMRNPLLTAFMVQAADADSMPAIPELIEVLAYGGDMLLKALNGVADPAETVSETTALINEANGH